MRGERVTARGDGDYVIGGVRCHVQPASKARLTLRRVAQLPEAKPLPPRAVSGVFESRWGVPPNRLM